MNTIAQLKKQGFDESTREGKYNHVKCSQCEALVINGIATHEHSCPNKPRRQP